MYFTFQGNYSVGTVMSTLPKQLIMSAVRRVASLPLQVLLTMQLSAFLLFAIGLQVSAATYSQTVSFTGKDVPLKTVFASLKNQTGYGVFFENGEAMLQSSAPVTLDLKNVSLELFLKVCLKDQPLDYTLEGKTIFIKKKEVMPIALSSTTAPIAEIKGRVTNDKGEPLVNANITVKRTGHGTVTDANGNFTLHNVTPEDVLAVTFIGYTPQAISIRDRKVLTLIMQSSNSDLDKVVVQAYGSTTTRLATGDIAVITSDEISKQPVLNPLQALQGRVAGLIVTQTNGFSSAPIKVELRGRNTINALFSSDPLYIIDGVPLTLLDVGGNSNYQSGSTGLIQNGFLGPAGGQSPIFSLNALDIESIEVLKDADATAIYGSRGANGVILITTKKGKAEKTRLDIRATQGMSKVTSYWDMLDSKQYLQIRREAFANDGIAPDAGSAPDLLVWDTTRYTNWQKLLWGNTGKNTDIQTSLSGGDAQTSFRASAGFNHTTNILTNSGYDQKTTMSLNVNHRSPNRLFSFSFTGNYSIAKSNMTFLPNVVSLPPNAPLINDENNKPNYNGWDPIRYQYPFASLLQPYNSTTNFLNSNILSEYTILKGLTFNANLGYNNTHVGQTSFITIASQDPQIQPLGSAQFGNNFSSGWIIEPQLKYNNRILNGSFSLLAGASLQSTKTEGLYNYGYNYNSDALLQSLSSAPNIYATDNLGNYQYAAIFGRLTYNIENKYILNINARRDGSSRFGNGKQFGNFGSIGMAWIFSEESWFKNNLQFLSYGKLRSNYGTTGSDAIGDYQYLTRWSSNGTQPYNNIPSIIPTQHANPDFHWQVNKKLEMALDLAILKDRIYLSSTYYRNRCDNQLVGYPLPLYTGFSTVTANSPALVQNTGWEFNVSAKIIETKNFKWSATFNTSINRNKLLSYPHFELSPYTQTLTIGKSLNIRKLLKSTGVDPSTGMYTFIDKNHDGQINISTDSTGDLLDYNLSPSFSGGAGFNFSYKTIQLTIFLNFLKQRGINALASVLPGTMTNLPVSSLTRWQKPGDITRVARPTTSPIDTDVYYMSYSDGVYTDASFLRASNISLSYDLSDKIKKSMIKGGKLFINAQNLFLLTRYKGIDPETQNFGGMPPSKIIVAGLSLSF